MIRRRSSSLSQRLTRMNLLVSGTVLVMAALAFFSYDLVSFRDDLIRNVAVEAQIIGENTVTALLFNDEQSASATLKGLERSSDVVAALVTGNDGSPFAEFNPLGLHQVVSHHLAANQTDQTWPVKHNVLVAHRIVFQGKSVGVVYILARLTQVGRRARQYVVIALAILLFCMAAGILIGSVSRRLIVRPIIALSETALLVSRDRDYSVRADTHAESAEISILVAAFNTMLAQIQQRDADLNDARTHLEARVQERTEELQSANRELEAFSYTVAHDLRGPLDAIGGLAFLLKNSPHDPADTNFPSLLEQLRATTVNMSSLIDDLLDFARASSAPVRLTPVDLSEIARGIVTELVASQPDRHVDVLIGELPEVLADPGLMRVVLSNLLRNSWKYTSHHPRACIEFGSKNGHSNQNHASPVFFIRDDGAGFDPKNIDKLFHPFERLHSKSEFSGTGIGLATVQRILARQGGTIWAEGAVEKGATFYFTVN